MNEKRAVLVTGGAGYIGSHVCYQLVQAGIPTLILDNLSTGWEWAIAPGAKFFKGDIGDAELVGKIFKDFEVDAVIHLAASTVVSRSWMDPLSYYDNNFVKTHRLLRQCLLNRVNRFIFSSTAAVYGVPKELPIAETAPTQPISPYGSSKLMVERMLSDISESQGANPDFRFVALRYFNVAGARMDGRIGQATPEASHLVKVACEVACKKRSGLILYGTDYPTADGTCIRDYIHVEDLAHAHLLALDHLRKNGNSETLNCGYGHGFSVKEVVAAVKKISGQEFTVQEGARRPGDPPASYAATGKIRKTLGWTPQYDSIEAICNSAFQWEQKLALKFPVGVETCR